MNEFKIINSYLKKLVVKNKSSLNLNDDVFFDVSKKTVVSVDTYVEGSHFIDFKKPELVMKKIISCLLYTSPSPRDATLSRMPSSA